MSPSKITVTVAACAVLASTNAFMPASMSANKPSTTKAPAAKASAAAILAAGAILQGAVCVAPVDAAEFDIGQPTTLTAGIFGSKSATEAAKPDSSKYDVQNQGSFAKKNSQGAVDYGSPKGTDFGDLAGKAAGVANENKGTNFKTNDGAKQQKKQGSNPADVAQQKAQKLAQKGQSVASSSLGSSSRLLSLQDDKAGIGAAAELGKQSPKLGGGSNWGNKDVVQDATDTAKDITTKSGGLKDALKQGAQTWSGKGNAFSAPASVATKPFGDVKKEQSNMQDSTGRESRSETLSRATASVKGTIDSVNNGGGDQYKGINPEQ